MYSTLLVRASSPSIGISKPRHNPLQDSSSLDMPGVGIRGMRERLRQLGGSLEINSSDRGTVVVARLPAAGTSLASG
jgi:signal transduction histidine kinase